MSQAHFPSDTQITRYEALAAIDANGVVAAPACLLVARDRNDANQGTYLLASGAPEQVRQHPAWAASNAVGLPKAVLIPGLVNAHTHLDLTHIGPRPFDRDAGFTSWVDHVRRNRHSEETDIAASIRRGVDLSLLGGTVAIGDIAGAPMGRPSLAPYRALAASPVSGVSFLEFFGIGNRLPAALELLPGLARELAAIPRTGVRPGLQPHAPNTVDRLLYLEAARLATELGLPLSTHLAETAAEREFIGQGTGPQRALLESLGIWDDTILNHVGLGLHPAEHLAEPLAAARFLVAHVNDCDDAAIELLARTGTSVAYCPRASEYFDAAAEFGPHRYREMLNAGINVALGTDSIVNLPAADVDRSGISVLDEMRLLHRRDRTDPSTLLRMGTVNGARALGLPPEGFELGEPCHLAGLVAVDVDTGGNWASALMKSSAAPRPLLNARGPA